MNLHCAASAEASVSPRGNVENSVSDTLAPMVAAPLDTLIQATDKCLIRSD
jgi:hypothetical protein